MPQPAGPATTSGLTGAEACLNPQVRAEKEQGTSRQVQFQTQVMVHRAQMQDPHPQVGQVDAGDLGAGPSNPGGAIPRTGDTHSLTAEQAGAIKDSYRDQAGQGQQAEKEILVVEEIPPQKQQQQDQQDEGGRQQYVSCKNRRIGGQLEYQRQVREPTPFRMPGHQSSRGYYTSTYERNRARMGHSRTNNKSSAVAALTPRQWEWYKQRVCLACGADH